MQKRNLNEIFKNAAGTVFLLAAAFFVCSTFLSMRAVLADPIAPAITNNTSRTTAANPRGTARATANPRAGGATSARAVSARTAVRSGGAVSTPNATTSARATANTSRANTQNARAVATRNTRANVSSVPANRAVVARTGIMPTGIQRSANTARVSLSGAAMRPGTSTSQLNYIQTALSGNYATILDPNTGFIAADAYSQCLDGYYACMDEICTARNQAQRRCACAGRVITFANVERSLEQANDELITVSGQLALLIATKGKDVSAAFQLTDAEKIMNCVSWNDIKSLTIEEAIRRGLAETGQKIDVVKENWCQSHGIYTTILTECTSKAENMCVNDLESKYGFNVNDLTGSGSDILANLRSWAEAKDKTNTITDADDGNVLAGIGNITNVLDGMGVTVPGLGNIMSGDTNRVEDSLANTWGYDLFAYAHNNVCGRVLDSCFNGIYEACGTPPNNRKCPDGSTSGNNCKFNYTSVITVNKSATAGGDLDFISSESTNAPNTAACFGYGTTTTATTASRPNVNQSRAADPYAEIRGPVADARRSIMQKYALDANADCDLYGEQLRTQAQNIGYMKTAAQQALQQKRLEFAQEEATETRNRAIAATTNFNNCINEISDCYNDTAVSNPTWSESRIRSNCATVSLVPSCYEEMVCNPSANQSLVVIDRLDSDQCTWSMDYRKNTCRNVVTMNEILTGVVESAVSGSNMTLPGEGGTGNSANIRKACLDGVASGIRDWKRCMITGQNWVITGTNIGQCQCPDGQTPVDESCSACVIANVATYAPNTCNIATCVVGFHVSGNECVSNTRSCEIRNGVGQETYANGAWGTCLLQSCNVGYGRDGNTCVEEE